MLGGRTKSRNVSKQDCSKILPWLNIWDNMTSKALCEMLCARGPALAPWMFVSRKDLFFQVCPYLDMLQV
jgi:hypothetical protein